MKIPTYIRWVALGYLLLGQWTLAANPHTASYLKVAEVPSAVLSLLQDAKEAFVAGDSEKAASLLERALRIEPRDPVLWHNLAGVRLQQADWRRAANLANKSNTLASNNKNYTWLRVRNWVVISLACEGMEDKECALNARKRASILAN